MRFKSVGRLRYERNPLKVILSIDQDIVNYYFALVPKYVWPRLNRQKWRAHISVVRNAKPRNMEVWKKHEGKLVEFEYDSFIRNDQMYYWLNAFSPALEEIRKELGLPVADGFTRSPDGSHRFHITIGNLKQHAST